MRKIIIVMCIAFYAASFHGFSSAEGSSVAAAEGARVVAHAEDDGKNHDQENLWELVSVPGCCLFRIPPTLELQGGSYGEMMKDFSGSPEDRVVAQPKNINDFDSGALEKYSRIIVITRKSQNGNYSQLGSPLIFSKAEMVEWENFVSKMAGSSSLIRIISRQPAKVVTINGIDMLYSTYKRTVADGPPALVMMYIVQNNDRIHTVILSYRESQSEIWKYDFEKVMGTFEFQKK